MKKILIPFVLFLMACSSQKKIDNDPLIYYAKTRCLGKCPVFDLTIYNNGSIVYNGIENVVKKGIMKSSISSQKLTVLKDSLINLKLSVKEPNNKLKRDIPSTIIKYNGSTYKFQHGNQFKNIINELNKIIDSL